MSFSSSSSYTSSSPSAPYPRCCENPRDFQVYTREVEWKTRIYQAAFLNDVQVYTRNCPGIYAYLDSSTFLFWTITRTVYTMTIPHSSYTLNKMLSSCVGLNRRPIDLKVKTLPTELPTHVVIRRKKTSFSHKPGQFLVYTRTILHSSTYTLLVYTWNCPRIYKVCTWYIRGTVLERVSW